MAGKRLVNTGPGVLVLRCIRHVPLGDPDEGWCRRTSEPLVSCVV